MLSTPRLPPLRHPSRRTLLIASCAAATGLVTRSARSQNADPVCRRCRGLGIVPNFSAVPFVFVEGQAPFNAEDAAIGQPCPLCRAGGKKEGLAEEARRQHESAIALHAQWEERMGQELLLVQTRHVLIHTQLKPADARRCGQKIEESTLRIQKAASSLALTPTRPADYQQMLLWGEPSWKRFREVMQTLYTPEQLGENWHNAGRGMMYDHVAIAHCYFTPKSARDLPPEYFAVKLAATRQIYTAAGLDAPPWLVEGFASYAQQAVFDAARVFTIYSLDRGPGVAVTRGEASRQSAAGKFRPWDKLLARELRDFEKPDYPQSLAMVAFLLDTEPAKFIRLTELLKARTVCQAALEEAYGKPIGDLEAAAAKWLARS
jgi:hypothetical protein